MATLKYLISTVAVVGAIGSAYAQATPPPSTDSKSMPAQPVSPSTGPVITQTPAPSTHLFIMSPAPSQHASMTRSAARDDLKAYRESGFEEVNRGDNIDPSSPAHVAAQAKYGQRVSSTLYATTLLG